MSVMAAQKYNYVPNVNELPLIAKLLTSHSNFFLSTPNTTKLQVIRAKKQEPKIENCKNRDSS